jgi:hypothetical protein
VSIVGVMLQIETGRRAVIFADGMDGAGQPVTAQILLEERFAGHTLRLALRPQMRAQEILRVRLDQPLRQRRRLDQEEPPEIQRGEALVSACVHGGGGRNIQHGHALNRIRMIQRHTMGHAAAAVMTDDAEPLMAQ